MNPFKMKRKSVLLFLLISIYSCSIDNKKNKYMASDCPLAGKHLNQLSKDTEIRHDEALHPIEIMAKAYKL